MYIEMVHPPHLDFAPYYEFLFVRLDYDPKLYKTGKIKIKKYSHYNQNSRLDDATLHWYRKVILLNSRNTTEMGNDLRTPHWRIKSGNLDFFAIKKLVFPSIDLYHGAGVIYWRFSIYTPNDKFKLYSWWGGNKLNAAPYCNCVGNHFKKTLAHIKDEMLKSKEGCAICTRHLFFKFSPNSAVCEVFATLI